MFIPQLFSGFLTVQIVTTDCIEKDTQLSIPYAFGQVLVKIFISKIFTQLLTISGYEASKKKNIPSDQQIETHKIELQKFNNHRAYHVYTCNKKITWVIIVTRYISTLKDHSHNINMDRI